MTTPGKQVAAFDLECYPNYFLAAFQTEGGKRKHFEMFGREATFPKEAAAWIIPAFRNNRMVGFNSANYDVPLLLCALSGWTCLELHERSKLIIETAAFGWKTVSELENAGKIRYPAMILNSVDIMSPSPGVMTSLKIYMGRLHSKKLQSLPYDPMEDLAEDEAAKLKAYCWNDLEGTLDLWRAVRERVDVRQEFDPAWGSKSDAQVAESWTRAEVRKRFPDTPVRAPKIDPRHWSFKYAPPDHLRRQGPPLFQKALKAVTDCEFRLTKEGRPALPPALRDYPCAVAGRRYQLGVGGLHSTEKKLAAEVRNGGFLANYDVAAYYPSMVLHNGFAPRHLQGQFTDIYRGLVARRMEAKAAGDKTVDQVMKIVINGCFGKFASKWSFLYSPETFLNVVLTGQLQLLLLAARFESNGIRVLSANTDGIVVQGRDRAARGQVIADWEKDCGMVMELTELDAYYGRDVSNYLAVKTGGGTKGKGIFSSDPLTKNPQGQISTDAAAAYLTDGTAPRDTVRGCGDIRKFLILRRVSGGAVWKGRDLGKVARWVWSPEGESIHYAKTGNKVAESAGARPVMDLDETEGLEIDFGRYEEKALHILESIGSLEGIL